MRILYYTTGFHSEEIINSWQLLPENKNGEGRLKADLWSVIWNKVAVNNLVDKKRT